MGMLNVLLVEDSPDYSALVLRWLSGDSNPAEFSLIWTDSLAGALARLESGDIDLILADLGLPDSDGLPTFEALRAKASELPIIVLSGGDSEALAIQTIQFGAQDYLVKSTCTPTLLLRTLRHAMVRHRSTTSRTRPAAATVGGAAKRAKTIAVLSASGGAGATTVACVLAAELQRHTNQSTLLMDLDAHPGQIAFLTGIEPQYSAYEAVKYADGLDRSIWDRLVTRGPGNLDILASSRKIPDADLDAARLLKIIAFAGDWYEWIVMDLGRLNRTSRHLLGSAEKVMVVSTDSIPALHQCKHAIEACNDLGIDIERVRLVLNRKDDQDHLSHQQIENLFGVRIGAILPPAHEDLYNAHLHTELPSVSGGFRLALSVAARMCAGLPEEQQKRSMLSLTSLRDRFRRERTETIAT